MSFQISPEQFADLHPYGWSEGELSLMLWILFSILVFAIVAYIFSAWKQVKSNETSIRSFSGIKRRGELSQEQLDRIEIAKETFFLNSKKPLQQINETEE